MSSRRVLPSPRTRAAAASLVLVGLASCAVSGAAAATVELTGRRFDPGTLSIPAGTEVVWHNTSTDAHVLTTEGAEPASVPEGATPWTSERLTAGERHRAELDVPGTYVVVCTIHADEGMVAVIEVES